MARDLLDDGGKQALEAAVVAIEAGSAVEVVLAVRRRSGSYLHADLIAAALAAYAVLVFLMLSPWPFSTMAFLVDPPLFGALAALLCARWPALRRVLSPPRVRREQVAVAAHATFHQKEVGLTHRRTGLLVYLSRLERAAVLIADKAILDAVDAPTWRNACAVVENAARTARDAKALAAALETLAEPLARALPRQADDVNELPDEVDIA